MARERSLKTLDIVSAVKELATPENPTTVRFVFYSLIVRGVLPENSQKCYNDLVRIVTDARIREELDDECFVDNKRRLHHLSAWSGLKDYRETMVHWYSRDRWLTQSTRPIICCEKDTISPVIEHVCNELQTPVVISSGYFSRPIMHKLAKWIVEQNKPIHLGYIGDADPSGFDMERALKMGEGKKEGLLEILFHEIGDGDKASETWNKIQWERLAITPEDLSTFQGPQLVPVKRQDPRAPGFLRDYGWAAEHDGEYFGSEVEALPQTELQVRVRNFIKECIDKEAWEESERLEKEDLKKLEEVQ